MHDLTDAIKAVTKGIDLSFEQAQTAAQFLAESQDEEAAKRALLVGLADKGETPTEVAGFAAAFRGLARDPGLAAWRERAIDVCGTGGDKVESFNISTAVSFILATAGVPVCKHGNRSVTSQCGSADLLESLGFPLELDVSLLGPSLEQLNFCFLFAPAYHPAFKAIAPLRRTLAEAGRRTIFNLIGPLINPAQPAQQLLGVFDPAWVSTLADVLDQLGVQRGLVVHGVLEDGRGLDELTCSGTNRLAGVGALAGVYEGPPLADLGLEPCSIDELAGGDAAENRRLLEALLAGEAPRGLRGTVCLNAGAGLWVAGEAENWAQGIARAQDLLMNGAVAQWLKDAQAFYSSL